MRGQVVLERTWYGQLSDLGDGEECLGATANTYRGQGDHALAMVYRPKLSGFDQRAGNGGLLVVLIIRIRGILAHEIRHNTAFPAGVGSYYATLQTRFAMNTAADRRPLPAALRLVWFIITTCVFQSS